MLHDAQDDFTLLPTALDLCRLEQLTVDGRMDSENGTWIALRYPAMPAKGNSWGEYVLAVNHPQLSQMVEFKKLSGLMAHLSRLERERLKRSSR